MVGSRVGRIRWLGCRPRMADWEILGLGFVDSTKRWGKDRGNGFADWECLARNVLVSGC